MSNLPSVSCVLPTGYGKKYVGVAIQSFLSQTYEGDMELIVVDNNPDETVWSDESISELPSNVVYVRTWHGLAVGILRNLGNSASTGDIIINWDEDDWSHPDRVAAQVARLQESGKAVTGFHNILFYDTESDRTYKYFYEADRGRNHAPYACGTSQCYLRSWWADHQYINLAEDWEFVKVARDAQQLDSIDAGHLCVARAHRDSQSPPTFGHRQFPQIGRETLPPEFFLAIQEMKDAVIPAVPEKEQHNYA